MSQLTSGKKGIPITIIEKDRYEEWLKIQSETTQKWLNSNDFKGEGLQLIPGESGGLGQVLLGVPELNNPFMCGDLINLLPKGEYHIDSEEESLQREAAFGWAMGAYVFERYKKLERERAVLSVPEKVKEATEKVVNAISMIRDLINTAPDDMMPQHLEEEVQKLAKTYGATFKSIQGENLLKENYPAIHAVGRASIHAPRLLDLVWGDESHPKLTLVGKGVCFDSGGLDIKNASGMRLMKKDMGGAAHVLGLAQLVMSHELPVRLRVMVPAVENAVAGNSFHPGDVLNTRKGLTVEIDNTDAEGRLVLCDAIAEANTEKPDLLIDFSTLTGAARIALGMEVAGFFTNEKQIGVALLESSETVQDPVWQLPLYHPYLEFLKSDIADLLNSASIPQGGAITAALYLERFVEKGTPWIHFDIMAFNKRPLPGRPLGGEAMGVRAMFHYLQKRYAPKSS